MTNEKVIIRVGSRKSELALIQTKHVIALLQKLFPGYKFEIHTMTTIGDRVLNISLPKIGEKSLFTRDLEDALRNGGVDFVVHSLKDLPTALPTGMAIGAILEREDARDALVLREELAGHTMETLPKGSVIGTSSLRRTAQIRRQYPHLVVCDIRGNLNTRLAKLDAQGSVFAGIILAQAGLVRMGWLNRISQVLEPADLLYAVGQGALAVECRSNDYKILNMLQRLMCLPTTCRILAERSFLKTLGGGCSAPVAVCSTLVGNLNKNTSSVDADNNEAKAKNDLSLIGAVWSLDGQTEIRDSMECNLHITKPSAPSAIGGNKRSAVAELEESSNSSDEPAVKRARNGNESNESNDSNTSSPSRQHSPPVINDDESVNSNDKQELLEKHLQLARKCPVIGHDLEGSDANGNNCSAAVHAERGAGDADLLTQTAAAAVAAMHCPLKFDVGQDVMGKCPFVDATHMDMPTATGKCPIMSKANQKNACDVVDCAPSTSCSNSEIKSESSTPKCPFSSMHNTVGKDMQPTTHNKCPFLQKTIQMFDYADEEKPLPHKVPALLDDEEQLFCGIYQHACYARELFARCNKLGQQLAEDLIKKGALDVMKVAQAEIHSKDTTTISKPILKCPYIKQ